MAPNQVFDASAPLYCSKIDSESSNPISTASLGILKIGNTSDSLVDVHIYIGTLSIS